MPFWAYTLKLADVYHNDEMSFEDRRDEIVKRIKAAKFYDEDDYELVEIIDELAETDTLDYFNAVFNAFYDWCDGERVWVETF